MILRHIGSQLWQLVPMFHRCIFRPDVRMTIVDVFGYQDERVFSAMELNAAVELS